MHTAKIQQSNQQDSGYDWDSRSFDRRDLLFHGQVRRTGLLLRFEYAFHGRSQRGVRGCERTSPREGEFRFPPGVREVPLPKIGAGSTAHTFLRIVTMLSLFDFISRCRDGEMHII